MSENETPAGVATTPIESDEERQTGLAQAEAAAAKAEKAAAGIAQAAASGQRIPPESTLRIFLSPQHPKTKFLVKTGELKSFPDQNSPTGRRETHREGDVFAQFDGGVLATDNPDVIEWCEAHGPSEELHIAYHQTRGDKARGCRAGQGVCCDSQDENAGAWCEMKAAQIPIASREATMSPSMNIDNILSGKSGGDRIGGEGERLVDAAKATRIAHEAAEARG